MPFVISIINRKNTEEGVIEMESVHDALKKIKEILKDLPSGWIIEIENETCDPEGYVVDDTPPRWLIEGEYD